MRFCVDAGRSFSGINGWGFWGVPGHRVAILLWFLRVGALEGGQTSGRRGAARALRSGA